MKQKIQNALKSFVPLQVMLVVAVIALRIFEWSTTSSSRPGASLVTSLWYDITFSFFIGGAALLVFIIVALVNRSAANIVIVILMTCVVIADFILIRYFSITHIPLSTDLFGYSWNDIQTTVKTSGNINLLAVVFALLFPVLFVFGAVFLPKWLAGRVPSTVSFGVAVAAILLFIFSVRPHAEKFENDQQYYSTMNKTAYFVERVISRELHEEAPIIFKADDYPFLHEVSYRNTIGKYFDKASTPPNLVFVIIEGLGREFVGEDAKYGGFTPFVDSLAGVSLYWKNALSNGGRTFAVLPSLLGSLPYGKEGFLSYGPEFPQHQTLISLLRPYHYYSSFYYGGDSHFDNMDLFLEYQKIDTLIDIGKFPKQYQVTKKNKEGFTWGYSDRDLFDLGGSIINSSSKHPRLEIFLTLSTHEPFAVPDRKYHAKFDSQLLKIEKDRDVFTEYRSVFECLQYTDDAIRNLINHYKKRADFNNTIFVITGDHRLIPVPQDTKISRFHVPIIIYSPLIKKPQAFESVVTHSSVPVAFLSMLSENFKMRFPDKMPFISDSMSTGKEFSSTVELALIRNKNETIDYISGQNFLSEGRVYTITPSLDLESDNDEDLKDQLQPALALFKRKSLFACENNRVDKPEQSAPGVGFVFSAEEKKSIDSLNLRSLGADELFFKARDLAFNKQYKESRVVSRYLLNRSPNYSDARILLARTFAWDHQQYDTAEFYLNEVLERSPNYADAYVALADIEFWKGNRKKSMAFIKRGLEADSTSADLLIREARAIYFAGNKTEARKRINALVKSYPNNELAIQVQKQIN